MMTEENLTPSQQQEREPRPRRIVYLVQGMGMGGLERVVLLLAGEMVRRGHEVTICCYDKLGRLAPEAETAGASVELVPRKKSLDLGYIRRLGRWLKRTRPDVLHMHNETALFYGTLAGRLARVPILIYTEHDGVFPRGWVAAWVNRRLVKRLTQAVAVSDAVRQLWCKHDGIDPTTVAVVPNGVASNPAERMPGEGRDPSHIRIGSVGRLSHEKGMDVLIEAFALVRQRLPNCELVLIGGGSARPELEHLASQRGLGDCVAFLGTRDDVPALLAGLDIFVLPSRTEGLPLAILEAMAAGLPIVATAVGGIPEAIHSESNGILVAPESPKEIAAALAKLADDEVLRRRLGQQARMTFEDRYGLSAMAEAYERLMDGSVGKPR